MSLAVDDSSFGALQDLGLIDHQGRPICAPDLVPKLLNLQKDHTGPGARNDLNPHVSKFLRMIVSGLSAFGEKTSRDGYLALTILLSRLEVDCKKISDLIKQQCPLEGATRREKGGNALGRVICYNSILDSGLFSKENDVHGTLSTIVGDLSIIGKLKRSLAESSFHTMIKYLTSKSTTELPVGQRSAIMNIIFSDGVTDCNLLWVLADIRKSHEDLDWGLLLSQDWNPPLVNRKNFETVIKILKNSPRATSKIHPVWNAAIRDVIRPGVDEREYTADAVSFGQLWDKLDGLLFCNEVERKIIGFELMSTVIASGSCVNITSLFTKNLCASLASALSADDDRLCRAATALVFKIAESVKKMPEISPALVPLLNNVKLRAALDLSAAKEIPESIKNAMTAENVHNYLGILKRAFLVEKNPYLEDATGDIRLLYLDSIYDLARTQTHIINDEMIEEYLAFVATQVLFKSTSGTSPSPPIFPSVPLDKRAREKAFDIFVRMLKVIASKSRDRKSGSLNDHLLKIVYHIEGLDDRKKTSILYMKMDKPIRKVKDGHLVLIRALQEAASESSVLSDPKRLSRIETLLNLCSWTHILLYYDSSEVYDFVEDLDKCCCILSGDSPSLTALRKGYKIDESLSALGVLVDILLLCLSKPSAFLRSLVKTVFANFAEDVDLSVAELIFSTLKNKDSCIENGEYEDIDESYSDEISLGYGESKTPTVNINGKRNIEATENDLEMAISDLDDAGIALMDEELSNVSKRLRLNTSTDNVTKELDFRFRMCVAYLIDILLAKNCSSRIKFDILELLTSTIRSLSKLPNGKAIKMRLNKIIEKNYSNTKNVPTVAAREATDALTKIHELSLSTSEADTIRSYGEISLFILKVVKVSSKLRSNQSSNNLENHGYEPEVADSLCDIYKDTLSKFLGSNKSKLRAHFFESFIRRSPELSWRLLPLIMDFIISNKLSKHRLVCAYRMLEILLRIHSGNKDPKFMDIIKGLGPEFIAVAQEEIDKMRTHTKEGQGNNNTSRKKLMIRCIKLFRHKCRPAGKERSGSPNRYEKRNKQPELIISNSDTPPVTAYSHSA